MRIPKPLTYTLIAILALIGLGIILLAVLYSKSQISTTEASNLCSKFFNEVKADAAAVPGYTVAKSSKACEPIEDEMGFKDYKLSVALRVAANDLDSKETVQASMKQLSDAMPRRNYSVGIHNILPTGEQPAALCLTASRYLNNDGKDIQQGPIKYSYSYSDTVFGEDSSACQ